MHQDGGIIAGHEAIRPDMLPGLGEGAELRILPIEAGDGLVIDGIGGKTGIGGEAAAGKGRDIMAIDIIEGADGGGIAQLEQAGPDGGPGDQEMLRDGVADAVQTHALMLLLGEIFTVFKGFGKAGPDLLVENGGGEQEGIAAVNRLMLHPESGMIRLLAPDDGVIGLGELINIAMMHGLEPEEAGMPEEMDTLVIDGQGVKGKIRDGRIDDDGHGRDGDLHGIRILQILLLAQGLHQDGALVVEEERAGIRPMKEIDGTDGEAQAGGQIQGIMEEHRIPGREGKARRIGLDGLLGIGGPDAIRILLDILTGKNGNQIFIQFIAGEIFVLLLGEAELLQGAGEM